ncbi:unnamed protein product [Albugo candida]|uniref:Uncharacterized protein n=1 Tax=Albugo candida TaxID=65357 RepID=A0A024FUI2_9STRA|nr:unnamed protein product [Albugo candida]|eukprot:CCI10813.1 unnamed protein product [Albugo candida]
MICSFSARQRSLIRPTKSVIHHERILLSYHKTATYRRNYEYDQQSIPSSSGMESRFYCTRLLTHMLLHASLRAGNMTAFAMNLFNPNFHVDSGILLLLDLVLTGDRIQLPTTVQTVNAGYVFPLLYLIRLSLVHRHDLCGIEQHWHHVGNKSFFRVVCVSECVHKKIKVEKVQQTDDEDLKHFVQHSILYAQIEFNVLFSSTCSSFHLKLFGTQFRQNFFVKRRSKTCALRTPKAASYVLRRYASSALRNIGISLCLNRTLVDCTVLRMLLHGICLWPKTKARLLWAHKKVTNSASSHQTPRISLPASLYPVFL